MRLCRHISNRNLQILCAASHSSVARELKFGSSIKLDLSSVWSVDLDVVSSWSETLDIGDAHDKIEISCYNNGIAEILLKRKEALPFAKMKIIVPEHVNLAIRAARLFLRTTNKVFYRSQCPQYEYYHYFCYILSDSR